MLKVLEIIHANYPGGEDTLIYSDAFKTAKEASKFIRKSLDKMQREINEDGETCGEPEWFWKNHKYDLTGSLPWWTDESLLIMTVKWPKI